MFGNRVTEADIRAWLDNQGYHGRSAKFDEVELDAIRRPGWLQVYRFQCTVKSSSNEWIQLWGVVKDDETQTRRDLKTTIWAFDDSKQQQQKLGLCKLELSGYSDEPEANWLAVSMMIAICATLVAVFWFARFMVVGQ